MIQGIRRLCVEVDSIPFGEDGSLFYVASEVWSAMIDLPEWPEPLQQAALELQRLMLRYGTISMSIDRMSKTEQEELRRELFSFCELAALLDRQDTAGAQDEASSATA